MEQTTKHITPSRVYTKLRVRHHSHLDWECVLGFALLGFSTVMALYITLHPFIYAPF